jgi:hypothetical protein
MAEYTTCVPGLLPDTNGVFEEDPCNDSRLTLTEASQLMKSFKRQCPRGSKWFPNAGKRLTKERRRLATRQEQPAVDVHKIQSRFAGKLVKSRDLRQSASELCNSKGSIGPNFYSHHEEKFCDMQKRKLYPRCEAQGDVECFDT